jgi:arylsulfatase A-like enzyme
MTQFLGGLPPHPDLDSRPSARIFEAMKIGGERLEYVKTLYDSEIRHTDEYVERVLAELGVTTDDLVIVLSDHGEEFGEHGLFAHGSSLHEASVRIPLIVRLPQEELGGLVVDERVSILDVFPTIAAAVQAPMPAETDGRNLLDGIRHLPLEPQPIILQLSRRGIDLDAFVLGDWKLVSPAKDPGDAKLFNLRDDPEERVDRAASDVAMADRVRAMLQARLSARHATRSPQAGKALNASQIEALKAMGYLQ